ncbi:MAG: class I SAM-dependent methyltransferase [Phycisphaerales bacterium]
MSHPTGDATYSEAITRATRYMRWVTDVMRPYLGRRLLEVGLGHGGYHSFFGPLDRYVGVDLDEAAVEEMRRRLPAERIEHLDIAASDVEHRLGDERFDTIVAINVLEHVPDDRGAIRNLASILEPGGHLLLWQPALPRIYNDLDRLAGHLRRYTRNSLLQSLPTLLEPVNLAYMNPIGGMGWWLNGWKRKRSLNDPHVNAQIAWFDRYGVPISKALNPITKRWFGQSIFLAARRGGWSAPPEDLMVDRDHR